MKKLTGIFAFVAFATLGMATMAQAAGKDYNVRVNPLGMAFGTLNGALDIGVGESMTIGPSFSYASVSSSVTVGTTTSTSKTTAYGFGLGMNLFLGNNRFTDSWVFSPWAQYASATAGTATASALAFGGDIGYQWFWDGGFNLGLGLGVGYYSFDASIFALSGVLPSGYFTIGYAF
ncbi:MAG: DUF3575 domain-containing protein [Oligoflexia bacterium]|nr:DUF3575 domain-containing protein [Oligoflexia bacterium]